MNFYELREYINRLKKIGENYRKELVELNLKLSFPFANLIIMLFSIPLVSTSTRSRGGALSLAWDSLSAFSFFRCCAFARVWDTMAYFLP